MDAHHRKIRDSNKKTQNMKPFNKNYKGHKNNRRYNSSNHENGETKDHKNSKKLTNDGDCPIHGASHKWGQCHQNQYGNNFGPKWSSASSQAGSIQSRSHSLPSIQDHQIMYKSLQMNGKHSQTTLTTAATSATRAPKLHLVTYRHPLETTPPITHIAINTSPSPSIPTIRTKTITYFKAQSL